MVYRRRRDALVAALGIHLPAVRIRGVAAGLHLMIELDRDADESAIVAAAASSEVAVYGVRVHRARPQAGPPALLLGYGAMSETAIAEGVARLAAVATGRPRRSPGLRERRAADGG